MTTPQCSSKFHLEEVANVPSQDVLGEIHSNECFEGKRVENEATDSPDVDDVPEIFSSHCNDTRKEGYCSMNVQTNDDENTSFESCSVSKSEDLKQDNHSLVSYEAGGEPAEPPSSIKDEEPSISLPACHNSEISCSQNELLDNPAYNKLTVELSHFKEHVNILLAEISRLKDKNECLEADRSHETYIIQISSLERTVAEQQNELHKLRSESSRQAEIAGKNYKQLQEDLEGKLQHLTKLYEVANADRESMVMRYVMSEKEVIDLKKAQESSDKKIKEARKECDLLTLKLKTMTAEKGRICKMLDDKCHELTTVQKENERFKDDVNSQEIKIKWMQSKLKAEIDSHKDTQAKLDTLVQKLQQCHEEMEQVRRDCRETIRAFQQSEDNRAHTLGLQLKEQQAKLIVERHEKADKEETHKQLQQEVDSVKKKNQVIIDENNSLSLKVQTLEEERLGYEQNLSKFKWSIDKQRHDIVDLQTQLAEMDALRMQMQHKEEKLSVSQAEVERLRESNEELLKEMTVCRQREAELLEFTQKLTEKNVRLQSEFSSIETKAQQLEYEQVSIERRRGDLEAEIALLQDSLQKEQQRRAEETALLAHHLAERTKHVEDLSQKVDFLNGEIQVLRRKNQTTIKELTRELQHYHKKELAVELTSVDNSLGRISQASSCSSLNTCGETNATQNNECNKIGADSRSHEPSPSLEPERQVLIERIIKLQKADAKKREKVEFLEEHCNQLLAELQKKTQIVQSYILREQTGALSSNLVDQQKAEMVKYGGIMAALYGSKTVDNTMTLELSLEINKKLQAVLEDTLLKNITLKENIDTLGTEIARLTMENTHKEL